MPTALVKNTTAFDRVGIITMGVPFSRAQNLREEDILVVNNALTGYTDQKVQWYPQGVRWDDGAIKYARVSFRTDLTAGQEKTVTISKSENYTAIPYALPPNLLSQFLGCVFRLHLEGEIFDIPLESLLSNLVEGGGADDHYARYKHFTHLPPGLDPKRRYVWVELVTEFFSNLNHVQFYYRFGYYRFVPGLPQSQGVEPAMYLTQPVTIEIAGCGSKIRWEQYKVEAITEIHATQRAYHAILPTGVYPDPYVSRALGSGVHHAYKGVLTFDDSNSSLAEKEELILGMCQDWANTYPITGVMPAMPSYITSVADGLQRSQSILNAVQAFVVSNRLAYTWPGHCNNPDTADAGQHGYRDYAYGLRGWPFMKVTDYRWIPFLEFGTRQQSVRHNWFYGTDGEPVPPNDLLNAGVRVWNGSYWQSPSLVEQLAGYSRRFIAGDVPRVANRNISGPDKEHFTNTLFIIQGFITMDYFSLEYAKMYSKYWVYSNRTDNYSGYFSEIDSWGVSRSCGRTYQCAAFLYEFYADQELKYWMRIRLDANLVPVTRHLLRRDITPGGTEVVRVANWFYPCSGSACLNVENHWRPWEEGQAALGLYLIAKVLLSENPADDYGLRLLQHARDSAMTVVTKGYLYGDARSSSDRRIFSVSFPNLTIRNDFVNGIGTLMPHTLRTRGLSSGAEGLIFFYHNDGEYGGAVALQLRIYLYTATGPSFQVGEFIQIPTGHTAQIYRVYPALGGQSRAISPPTQGFARDITESESRVLNPLPHLPFDWPVGNTKWVQFAGVYHMNVIQTACIAKEAALISWYPDSNPAILATSQDLLDYYLDAESDNGDWDEGFICFAGYLIQNLSGTSGSSVFATTLETTSSIEEVTTSVVNPVQNVSVNARFSDIVVTLEQPGVVTTTTSNVVVLAKSINIFMSVSNSAAGIGKSVTAGFSTITLTSSPVASVITTVNNARRRVHVYTYFGRPDDPIIPSEPAGDVPPTEFSIVPIDSV